MNSRPLIGVVSPVLSKAHTQNIICGVSAQASECGCDVIIMAPLVSFTGGSSQAKGEQVIFDLIASQDFDGFLYVKDDTTMGIEVIARVEELLAASNKYVMAVDEEENALFDSTQYDDYYDFSKVVEHLVQVHGYRRIHCLTGPEELFQSRTRLRAFMDVMNKYGLPCDESCYTYGTFWVDSSQELARRMISGEIEMPQAVVCGNDITAMSLIKCLQGAGIRVPEDVAVTGYDGYSFTANVDVVLTTYLRDHFQLGADAMRRLYRNISGKLCRKVSRPDDGFMLGSSCGCREIPADQLRIRLAGRKPKMWLEEVFCDDTMIDLHSAQTSGELIEKALWHCNMLYGAEQVSIYLSDEEDLSDLPDLIRLRGRIKGERVDMSGGRAFSRTSAAGFSEDGGRVQFLSPIHYGDRQFGYISVSFYDSSSIYDRNFLDLTACLDTGLERILAGREQPPERSSSPHSSERKLKADERYRELSALRRKMQSSPEKLPSIDRICAEIGMSRSSLQKNYSAFFGNSVFDDLIRFRIEKAKRLLAETSLSIAEVAESCGYSSESYFMKQFKKLTGMTPTEFRKNKEPLF
ncbi:MAG: substrate-binding domain-containing protein [Ruminococcus sp.]|nr:substrate-binding domain-containing protein [Ruminococcus sp.]